MQKIVHFFTVAILFTALVVNAAPLEIINKSTDEVKIDINLNKAAYLSTVYVLPGESFFAEVVNEPLDIEIEVQTPQYYSYRFSLKNSANNKSKYLVWDPKGRPKKPLHPQSKRHLDQSSKSHSKHNLDNNISQKEIILEPKTIVSLL